MPEIAQPNASQMPFELLEAVLDSISTESSSLQDIVYRDQHSNDFAEVRLQNGRALIVKRARYDWAEPRFEASQIASQLIREATCLAVPEPLPLPSDMDPRPVEAYWRIDLPTLEEIWDELDERQRRDALRSWGELIARVHSVGLEGFGLLSDDQTRERSLDQHLRQELEERLLPAVTAEWPAALPALHRLIRAVDEVAERVGDRSRLVHNDMHMGNVLCDASDGSVRCVGLIDLETALAAPPEADLAVMELHHGPLFDHPIGGEWLGDVYSGYPESVDPHVTMFYRGLHLINMGFYSAMIGHEWHAQRVAAAATRETAGLERGPVSERPRSVVLKRA